MAGRGVAPGVAAVAAGGLGFLLGRAGQPAGGPGDLQIPDWGIPLLARLEVATTDVPRQNLTAQPHKVVQNIAWQNALLYERSVINFAIIGDLLAHPVVVLARASDPAQQGAVVEYNACLSFLADWEAQIWYGGQLVLAQARGTIRGICIWINPDLTVHHTSGG